MSLRDDIANETGSGDSKKQPKNAFIKYLNRAGSMASNPFFESGRKRTSREMYEACWRECTSMDLTADESHMIRLNLGEFYHRMYPERVQQIEEYRFALRDPATVIEVSDRQRAVEAHGFTPESIRLPPDPADLPPVTPQEIAKSVKLPVTPVKDDDEMPF